MAEHNGGNRGGNRGNFGGNRDDRGSYRPNNNSGGDRDRKPFGDA